MDINSIQPTNKHAKNYAVFVALGRMGVEKLWVVFIESLFQGSFFVMKSSGGKATKLSYPLH